MTWAFLSSRVQRLIPSSCMQHLKFGFAVSALLAVGLVTACGGNAEQGREEAAAREFRLRLAQNRADLIYKDASDSLRKKMTEKEFRKMLFQAQVLGIAEQSERANYQRTQVA